MDLPGLCDVEQCSSSCPLQKPWGPAGEAAYSGESYKGQRAKFLKNRPRRFTG
jgi:hypothetical protein